MPQSPTSLESLSDLLELSVRSSESAKRYLRCEINDESLQSAVLLLEAILDHARGVIALNRACSHADVSIICRSAIDAYVDLVNLCESQTYLKDLEVGDTFQWRRFLESTSRGDNPNLDALGAHSSFPAARRQMADREKALLRTGAKKMTVEERFEKAGLTREYESAFHFLSFDVHNSLSFLRARYGGSDNRNRGCTLTMSELVIRSTEKILGRCGHGTAVMSAADKELQRLHASVQGETRDQGSV
jgi:hypothetical protein